MFCVPEVLSYEQIMCNYMAILSIYLPIDIERQKMCEPNWIALSGY